MLRKVPDVTYRAAKADTPVAPAARFVAIARPRPKRILDFDSEQIPDAWLGADITTKKLSAIAWSWVGSDEIHCELLRRQKSDAYWHQRMLTRFVKAYDQADIVTGHNIRRHDLPIINASLVYYGLGQLAPKLTSDTLRDSPRSGLVYSRSQENLGMMLETEAPKYHMNNHLWKQANTLEQVELARDRCIADVRQHKELRERMIEEEILKPPRWWRP